MEHAKLRLTAWANLFGTLLFSAVALARSAGETSQESEYETLILEPVADGLVFPVWLTSPPGETSRLFVLEPRVEGSGRVRIIDLAEKRVLPDSFLEVAGVSDSYEEGLLGLAFHPDFRANGYLYIYYTTIDAAVNPVPPHRASRLERYHVSPDDPNHAEADSAAPVLSFPQPTPIHNGGWLAFGADGYLYLSTGDGGPADNPPNASQALADDPATLDIRESLMGRMLRLDVDGDHFPVDPKNNYAIPSDNPFRDTGAPETWIYGLRNPWRASFDRETGDLWIGDVGNLAREELDFQPASSSGGENYGWPAKEGTVATAHQVDGSSASYVSPVSDYGREVGACVTGGYVYRGSSMPWLRGTYFYADYAMGWVKSFRYDGAERSDERDWTEMLRASVPPRSPNLANVSSFGEDADGELYLVDPGGRVYRLAQSPDPLWRDTSLAPEEREEGEGGLSDVDPSGNGSAANEATIAGSSDSRSEDGREVAGVTRSRCSQPACGESVR